MAGKGGDGRREEGLETNGSWMMKGLLDFHLGGGGGGLRTRVNRLAYGTNMGRWEIGREKRGRTGNQ